MLLRTSIPRLRARLEPGSRRLRTAVIRISLVALAVVGIAEPVLAQRLPIRNFSVRDGLAHDRINHIAHDRRGYLWFATRLGLSRFDGNRFVNYQDGEVRDARYVFESSRGEFWVGTGEGVFRLHRTSPVSGRPPTQAGSDQDARAGSGPPNVRFERVPVDGAEFSERALILFEDRANTLWLGTGGGLFRLDRPKDRFVPVSLPAEAAARLGVQDVMSLGEDRLGRLWLGTWQSFFVLEPPTEPTESIEWTLIEAEGRVRSSDLLVDSAHRLWLGTTRGLFVVHDAAVEFGRLNAALLAESKPICSQEQLRSPALLGESGRAPGGESEHVLCEVRPRGTTEPVIASAMSQAPDGTIWVGLFQDLLKVSPDGDLEFFTPHNGLPPSVIRTLGEDSSGSLWLGHSTYGATRVARSGFITYGMIDGLEREVQRIVRCEDSVYFTHHATTLFRLGDDGRFVSIHPWVPKPESGQTITRVPNMVCDSAGSLWMRTDTALLKYPPVRRLEELEGRRPEAVYRTGEELFFRIPRLLYEDSRSDLWITYYGGIDPLVTRYDRDADEFRTFSEADGLPAGSLVAGVAEDGVGAIWVGLREGLGRIVGDRIEVYTEADGLPAGRVYPIFGDSAGRLWVRMSESLGILEGTLDLPLISGADRSPDNPEGNQDDSEPALRLEPIPQLEGQFVVSMSEDAWGGIFASTMTDVVRLDLAEGTAESLGAGGGLLSTVVYDSATDPDGSVWVATAKGLSHYVHSSSSEPVDIPPARFTEVAIDDVAVPIHRAGQSRLDGLVLSPSDHRVRVVFTAIDFEVGRRLMFRHRLVESGASAETAGWSAPITDRSVVLAGLSVGQYRFEVQPVVDGRSGPAAELSFEVLAPIWRRGWFLALAALTVGLGLLVGHRLRLSRLLAVEQTRTRIATDLHDDVGSTLARISVLSEVGRTQSESAEARATLDRIGESARELIEATGDIVWAIDPERDDLPSLVTRLRRFAEELVEGRGVAFGMKIVGAIDGVELSAVPRRHLWLICKEALHNAVRHASASRIEIEVSTSGATSKRLAVSIVDDGVGLHSDPGPDPDFDPDGRSLEASLDAASESNVGRGIANMKRRAEEIGGRLDLLAGQPRGSRVVITVPI